MSDYPEMCPVCHKADADLCFCSKAAQDAAWNRRAQPAAPSITGIGTDKPCDVFPTSYSPEVAAHADGFLAAKPASPADAAPSVAPEPPTREALAEIVRLHLTSTYHCTRVWEAWHVGTMTEDDFEPASESDMAEEIADAILAAYPPQAHSVAPEPVAWRYVPSEVWCDHILTEDTKTVELARQYGREVEGLYTYSQLLAAIAAAHPPRAPLTEEIESADNLLRHLGLDPERCRTEGGSLNVSRIKTLLADAAPTARESAKEELLRSAAAIAQRHGAGTAWDRFGASIKALGIGAITARTYRLLPSDTERQQPPTTDPSRLADDLSNIGTMSPRIRKLYDDAAAFIRSTQAPLAPWQSMKTAPKDGAAVLVLLDASNIPHAARWLSGPDDRRATEETTRAGWHLTWDGSPIEEHDGPRYWMHCPDDPDESDIEAAHGIGGK